MWHIVFYGVRAARQTEEELCNSKDLDTHETTRNSCVHLYSLLQCLLRARVKIANAGMMIP